MEHSDLNFKVFEAPGNGYQLECVESPREEADAQEFFAASDTIYKKGDEYFIGKGNYGAVFKYKTMEGSYCIKKIWPSLSVECGGWDGDKYFRLPPEFAFLRTVQEHFTNVKAARNEFIAAGRTFAIQNDIVKEGEYTLRARIVAARVGLENMIPKLQHVSQAHRIVDGQTEKGEIYEVDETVHTLVLEEIPGITLEDLIINWNKYQETREKVDVQNIQTKIDKLIHAFDADGFHHNDISLRNIMIGLDTGEPYLIDFGASSSYNGSLEEDLDHLNQAIGFLKRSLVNPEVVADKLNEDYGE